MSDVTISLVKNDMTVHRDTFEPWNITLINRDEFIMTSGRTASPFEGFRPYS